MSPLSWGVAPGWLVTAPSGQESAAHGPSSVVLSEESQFLFSFHGLFQKRCYTFMAVSIFEAMPPSFGDETVVSASFLRPEPRIRDCHLGSRDFQFGSDPAAPGRTIQINILICVYRGTDAVKCKNVQL